jgi:4-hydroxybenzoate polyprenyltransferase
MTDKSPTDTLERANFSCLRFTLFHSFIALLGLYSVALMGIAATDGHPNFLVAVLGLAALSGCVGIEMRK